MAVVQTVQAVRCAECEELHAVENKHFIAVHGNLTIGLQGGVIGNNLEDDGKLKNVTILCVRCFKTMLAREGVDFENECIRPTEDVPKPVVTNTKSSVIAEHDDWDEEGE